MNCVDYDQGIVTRPRAGSHRCEQCGLWGEVKSHLLERSEMICNSPPP